MKTLIIVTIFSLMVGLPAYAEDWSELKTVGSLTVNEAPDVNPPLCTKFGFRDEKNCFDCHMKPNMQIRETKLKENYAEMPYGCEVIMEDGELYAYMKLSTISSEYVKDFMDYFFGRHNFPKVVIDIFSGGGSLFDGSRIVSYFKYWQAKDKIIETRIMGFAASAAFFVGANGSPGYRYMGAHAECMWHEAYTFKMFDVSTASSKKDEAEIMRHLQDTMNERLSEVSNVTKEELDEKISKQEYWLNGKEAVKLGFADHLI